MAHLSGQRLMWMMVMFDLPTGTQKERKKASQFRQFLLDEGFEMSQFSVYFRFCGDRSRTAPYIRKIKKSSPAGGKISILLFTDKQFSDIVTIQNRSVGRMPEKPEQFALF